MVLQALALTVTALNRSRIHAPPQPHALTPVPLRIKEQKVQIDFFTTLCQAQDPIDPSVYPIPPLAIHTTITPSTPVQFTFSQPQAAQDTRAILSPNSQPSIDYMEDRGLGG